MAISTSNILNYEALKTREFVLLLVLGKFYKGKKKREREKEMRVTYDTDRKFHSGCPFFFLFPTWQSNRIDSRVVMEQINMQTSKRGGSALSKEH